MIGFLTISAWMFMAAKTGIDAHLVDALQKQIPVWAAVTGNDADPDSTAEPLVLQRSLDSLTSAYLPKRRLELSLLHVDGRYWIIDAFWCAGSAWNGRRGAWWTRTPSQWDTLGASSGGAGFEYAMTRLVFQTPGWDDPVPRLRALNWPSIKAVCQDGICFVAKTDAPDLGRAAIAPNGKVLWWDGGRIKDVPNESELVHGYGFVLEKGHFAPFGSPALSLGQTAPSWYRTAIAEVPSKQGSIASVKSTPKPKPLAKGHPDFLLDSIGSLFQRAEVLDGKGKGKLLDGRKLERIRDEISGRKSVARRKAGEVECSGSQLQLARYEDGTEALLEEGKANSLVLRGASIALLGVNSDDSAKAVQAKLGKPSGASETMLHYRSTQPYPDQKEYFSSLWDLVFLFQNGKLRAIVLARSFDDC